MKNLPWQLYLVLILTCFCQTGVEAQSAGIKLEGLARVRYQVAGKQLRTSTYISSIANFNYQDIPIKLSLVLSRRRYISGRSVKGKTAASASGTLMARSRHHDINFEGATSVKKGKYRAMILVMDLKDQILAGMNLLGRIRVRASG